MKQSDKETSLIATHTYMQPVISNHKDISLLTGHKTEELETTAARYIYVSHIG